MSSHRLQRHTRQNRDEEAHRRSIEKALSAALTGVRALPAWNESYLLLTIADMLLDLSERTVALNLVEEAFDAHAVHLQSGTPEASPDHDFLREAAHTLARAGRTAMAIRTALRLQPPSQRSAGRDSALASLAATFGLMGNIAAAQRVMPHLQTALARLDTLWAIAEAHARAGQLQQAATTIRLMRGSALARTHRRIAWQSVAKWLAFRGDETAAMHAAKAIHGAEEGVELLAEMAEWAAAKQPPELPAGFIAIRPPKKKRTGGRAYLAAALAAARRLDPQARVRMLFRIGLAAARVGEVELALAAVAQLAATERPKRVAEIQCEIARLEAREGKVAKALGRRMARPWRAIVLADIAAAQAAEGNQSAALATAFSITNAATRIKALLDIAAQAAAQGRTTDAVKQLRSVAQLAIPDRARIRTELIEEIAAEQARVNDFCGAARTLLCRRDYPHAPNFAPAAIAFAQVGNDKAAALLARRTRSADDNVELTAKIALLQHARTCPRCRKQF